MIGLIAAATVLVAWFGLLNLMTGENTDNTASVGPQATAVTTPEVSPCGDPTSQAPECIARRNALETWSTASVLADDLNARSADVWASDRFAQAVETYTAATELFQANAFFDAESTFTRAVQQFEDVQQFGRETFDAALQTGWAALENAASKEAAGAFEDALRINPDSDEAKAGLERAQAQAEMIDLYYRGVTARSEGRLDDARSLFEQAQAKDPESAEVSSALRDVIEAIRNANYRDRLSAGFKALEDGDATQARSAFTQALTIQPGSAEATSGLQQADALDRSQSLESLISNANALAQREMWEASRALYAQALDIDATAQTAIEGKATLDRLLELEMQIDHLIARPFRMSSVAVYQFAENVVVDANAHTDTSPRLAAKVGRLTGLMTDMQTPVRLTLQSDGRTSISVQRFGDIGRFEERVFDILPGTYAITGARPGFRDVRHDVEVLPGSAPITLTVICNDEF